MSISVADTAQTSFPTAELEARAIAVNVLHMSREDALDYLETIMAGPLAPHPRATARRLYLNLTDPEERA